MDPLLQRVDTLITLVDNAINVNQTFQPIQQHNTASKPDTNQDEFTVISFNILADCYALSNSTYPTYCSKQYLDGDYRFNFITNILSKYNGDIIALQEVDKPETIKLDDKEYEIFYQKRTNSKQDGLLLAFNKNKFTTYCNKKAQCLPLNDLCHGIMSENSKIYYKRDCIALYMILSPINNPKHVIIVSNTHLYYHRNAADIRLRQTAYIINAIYSKYNELKNDTNVDKISLLFCGDLNTLPNTSPFEYLLNGSYIMRAKGNSTLKLIMDLQLNKLCRWLRSLGVDTACFNKSKLDKTNIELLFDKTKNENRILVTRSKKLTQRKQCPNHLLLKDNNIESNLREIIKYFGVQYNEDTNFYSRCTICNGELKNLKTENEIRNNDKIPDGLKQDIYCSFWECLECESVIWFGLDENGKKDKLTDTMQLILEIMSEETENEEDDKKDDEKNEELDEILKLLSNLQRFFWEDVIINNPFNNKLKCCYMEINNGKSPKYTNKTDGFEGCLDYIMYANIYNNGNNQTEMKCIDSKLIEGNKEFYPNETWPSDHIMLISTFKFK